MPTASLSLAGCGSDTTAASPATSTAHPTPSASTNFPDTYAETATADPADSPTSDIMDEVNNPLRLECDDGGVSESFTSLKDAWAYDGDLYSCTGTVNDFYSNGGDDFSAALEYATSGSYGEEANANDVNPASGELVGICAAKDESAEGLLEHKDALRYAVRGCRKVPQAKLMRSVSKGEWFLDGEYVVKEEVKLGRSGRRHPRKRFRDVRPEGGHGDDLQYRRRVHLEGVRHLNSGPLKVGTAPEGTDCL